MEFETAPASFLFNAKPHGSEEDKRRSKIADPASRDLIVNALSQAAAGSSLLTMPHNEQHPLQNVSYPLFNTQPGYGNLPMPLLLLSPVRDGVGPFPCPPPNYETVTWTHQDAYDQNGQKVIRSGFSVSIQAAATPLQCFDPYSPDIYALDSCSGFNNIPSSDATFAQTAASTQPGFASANDYLSDNSPLATHTTDDQVDCIEHGFFQFGLPGQPVPSTGYFSSQYQQQFTQGLIGEYLIPPFSVDPTARLLPVNSPEKMPTPHKQEEEFEFQPNPMTALNRSEAVNQIPPPLPSQDKMMANFSLGPEPPTTKRPRKTFTKEGKKKVHAVRVKGACTCCQARKLSCSPDGVCETCLRLVSNRSLAHHICVRTKMKDDYVGVKDLHHSLDRRRANIEPLTSSLTGLLIQVQLCVKSELGIGGDMAQLNLQVMRCSSSPNCRWKRLERLGGILVTSDITYDERYVIVPCSLPSVDDFDTFGRKILLMQGSSHSGAITWYLDRFLSLYCSKLHPSSMRPLANLTSRIASLNNLVAYGFLNLHDGSFDLLNRPHGGLGNERYVSETVHDQVRVRVAEGLGPAERLMASELDKLMKIASAGRHSRIIAGICLLRLVLIYRDRLVRDEIRISLPNNTNRHQYRLEKAASFYKRLTIAYSTLCREKDTPLTLEWEDESGVTANARDAALKDAYLELQPAFQQFCEEKLCRQHDDVFKELIAEPLLTHHQRKRRRISR